MADIDNFNGVIIDDSVTPTRMRNLRVSDLVSGAGNVSQLSVLYDPTTWTKEATQQLVFGATPYGTIYWPWVIKATDHIATPLGTYYMYFSTDHDSTVGGIALAYSNSPLGPWTVHGQVYVDTSAQSPGFGQTETPSVVWDAGVGLYRMFYQQSGAKWGAANVNNAVGTQSTLSATSANGLTWTKDPNFILDIPSATAQHGDGHTGYFEPFQVDGAWNAYSLYGGTNGADFVLWRSDGQLSTWNTDAISLGYSFEVTQGSPLNGRHTAWNSSFVASASGQKFIVGRLSNFASGATASDCLITIAPVSDDLRRLLGRPTVIWTPTLPWESIDLRSVTPFIDDGRLYVYYSVAKQAVGVIHHAI